MQIIEFIMGLIVFAALLVALFPWLDGAHFDDRANYDTTLADAPEYQQPPYQPASKSMDASKSRDAA